MKSASESPSLAVGSPTTSNAEATHRPASSQSGAVLTIESLRSSMDGEVRVATIEDAAAIRSIYAPYVESTPISFAAEPPSVADLEERIEEGLDRYPWLLCETDAGVVGYAKASPLRAMAAYDWSVELSVYVAEDASGSGVGSALYSSLLSILEEQGFCSAYAAVTVPNDPSVALHERRGFEPVGTFPDVGHKGGEWHDVQWWRRALVEHPEDPDRPTPFPELRGTAALSNALATGERHLED